VVGNCVCRAGTPSSLTMKALAFLSVFLGLCQTSAFAKHRHARHRALPVAVYTRSGLPNVQAHASVVLDFSTGEELFAKNPDAIRPIASISKLMATMVVLDRHLELDKSTTLTPGDLQIARGGARSRLPIGMAFTNRDLLHAALMASDNRAVPALGRAVGLDPNQMVHAMNAKARELGLKKTHFEDPVGLSAGNRSTPRDVAGMLKAAIRYPLLTEITHKAHHIAHPVGKPAWNIEYNNTDVIARSGRYEVITGKTGYTDLALYCLAIAVRMSEHHDVGMVFLGAVGKMTRFGDFGRVAQWLAERKWSKGTSVVSHVPR
jgi:D-alanyl-D-alanine endopeptidase (penicillin-binding protein 7)